MPIRILRFRKRPPGAEQTLREISEKLRTFTERALTWNTELQMCIGCGKVGVFFCDYCRELDRLARIKADKPMSTVEQRFATRRIQ